MTDTKKELDVLEKIMNKDEMIKELLEVADIYENMLENCMLCDKDHKVVANRKDMLEDEYEIRETIFRVTLRKFTIVPF